MNKSLVIASLLISSSFVAAIAGCKTDNGGDTSSTSCGALYDAYSAYYAKCSPQQQFGDKDAFLKVCELNLASPGAAGASSALSTCANAISGVTSTCGEPDSNVCETSGGSLASGAACGSDLQCASAYCKGGGITESNNNGTVTVTANCGVCADKLAVGQACTDSDRCVENSVCDQTTGTGGALTGKCTAIVKNDVGGPCAGDSGGTVNQCKAGLNCGADGKCAALVASGGACTSTNDCVYPLTCSNSVCGTGLAVGATCDTTTVNGCSRDLNCDLNMHKCLAIVAVDPGGACDDVSLFCKHGNCHLPTTSTDGGTSGGVCPTLLNEGDACDASSLDKVCSDYLTCLAGKCSTFDPSTCK